MVHPLCAELGKAWQHVSSVAHVPVGVPPLLVPELLPELLPEPLPELLPLPLPDPPPLEVTPHWLAQFWFSHELSGVMALVQDDSCSLERQVWTLLAL